MERDRFLPNPFSTLQTKLPPPDPRLAEVIDAIEAELAAWIDPPPLFLRDHDNQFG